MEEIFLDAQLREGTGRAKVKDLKEAGFLPAVVYSQGKDALPIKISRGTLLKLMHQHRLESIIINLKIKDDKLENNGLASNSQSHKKAKARPCLVKEIQHNPVSEEIIHVDFNEISLTEAIKVNVPIETKGDAAGVKQEGGSLEHLLWEIEVECLPTNIPKNVQVDINALKMGEAIYVKDIILPQGIKVLNDPTAIVLHVIAPMKEEVPVEAVEGEVTAEPEVIKEKKEIPAEGEAEQETKEKEKK